MASIQLIPKLKRAFSDEKERKQAIAWIMMAALCTSAVWVEFRSEPDSESYPASSSSIMLPRGGRFVPAPAEAVTALKVKSPMTFNQFMGLLKKETPKPLAAKVAASFMKEPVLADAVKEFTEPSEAGERPASEFMARVGNLPEFRGFMQGMGGSSSAQAAFQRLSAMPQVDDVLRSASARAGSTAARGAAGARSSRAAFGDLAAATKPGGANLANKDQTAATGVGKTPSVPPVGAWREVGTITGPAGSPLMAASYGGAIEGGGGALTGEGGGIIQPISSPSEDVKTIKLNPPPSTAQDKKEEEKKEEKKDDHVAGWKRIVGGIFGAAGGFALGMATGNPIAAATAGAAGAVLGWEQGPAVIDGVGNAISAAWNWLW